MKLALLACLCAFFTISSSAQTYCTPTGMTSGLSFNLIWFMNNSGWSSEYMSNTGATLYSDFSTTSVNNLGRNCFGSMGYGIANSTGSNIAASTCNIRAYVDWNRDGDFDDFGEVVYTGTNALAILSGSSMSTSAAFSFVPPPNTAPGKVRLRFAVRLTSGTADACGGYQGEIEDYSITVTNNAAPVLNSGTPIVNTLLSSQTDNSGFSVRQLVNSTKPSATMITDADCSGVPPNGIAITSATGTNGSWQYMTPTIPWTGVGALSLSNALLLLNDDTCLLRFVPTGEGSGTLQFKAWDMSEGTHASYNIISGTGGTTAFSTATQPVSVTAETNANPLTNLLIISANAANDYIFSSPIERAAGKLYQQSTVLLSQPYMTNPTDFAWDGTNNKIIWTESAATDRIVRSNLDGSGVESIISSGLSVPQGIATSATKLFVADNGIKAIISANLDGTGVTTITGSAGKLATPNQIRDIEYSGNKLYVIYRAASSGDYKVMEINTDGTGGRELASTPTVPFALAVSATNVYWTEAVGVVKSAPISGTGVITTLGSLTTRQFRDLIVDEANNRIYVSDAGTSGSTIVADRTIWSLPLTGGSFTKVLTLADVPTSLMFTTIMSSLPVHFGTVAANWRGEDVLASWTTLTEMENDYFVVEHSTDGVGFASIGRVSGHGTTSSLNGYSLLHVKPGAGNHYYRVRQVDRDGRSTYSPVMRVSPKEQMTVKVWPNPTSNIIRIETELSHSVSADLSIVNANGNTVMKKTVVLSNQILEQDLSLLPNGVYTLTLKGKGVDKTIRITVIK
jgi:hypothetical protein